MTKTTGFLAGWTGHRKALLELIDVFETSQLGYKPWDKAMSVSELVLHISGASTMFVNTIKNGVFTPPSEQKTAETIKDLKKIVLDETEQTTAAVGDLTEEQLNQMIDFYDLKMPGYAYLDMLKDHEIHHKGQLFTYARLLGAEKVPPLVSR